RHPRLKLVMDHLGLAGDKKDAEAFRDLDQLLVLARRPNVAVKASILPFFVTDPYPYRSLHPYLRRVYEAYGPQRLFWGTDLSPLPCTYRRALQCSPKKFRGSRMKTGNGLWAAASVSGSDGTCRD